MVSYPIISILYSTYFHPKLLLTGQKSIDQCKKKKKTQQTVRQLQHINSVFKTELQ